MCNIDVPRFRLPDRLSSQCDANSSLKDGPPPDDFALNFLAKFVTAKDIVDDVLDDIQAFFCSKLWLSFCQQLKCKTMELENCGNESRRQIAKAEASNAILLDKVDSLQAELEQERIKFNTVVQEAEEKASLQTQEVARRIQNNEHQECFQGRLELEQRIQRLEEENLSLADQIKELEKEAKCSEGKMTLLASENQTLNKTRAEVEKFQVKQSDYEKFQAVRSKRLSLKREKNDLAGDTNSSPMPAVRVSAPDLRRCESPHVPYGKNRVQFRLDPQCQPSASDAELSQVRRGLPSTSCDGAADDQKAVKTPPGNLKVKKEFEKLSTETPYVERSIAKEDAEDEAARQTGLGEKLESEEALDVQCNQVEKASQDVDPPPVAADDDETFDSDETVMDLDHQQISQPGIIHEPQVIGIASDSQTTLGDEPMELALGASKRSRAMDTAAIEHDVEDRSALPNGEPLDTNRLGRSDSKPALVSGKSKSRPGNSSWREAKPRLKTHEGNFIDSFLATPLAQVAAQLAANAGQQAETTNCIRGQPQGNAASAMGQDLLGNCMEPQKKRKSSAREASSSAGSELGMKGSGLERTEKKAFTLKARPAYKYQETVRKKSDREALEGTDCRQCKKFYDAVEADDKAGTLLPRCEHHNEVSRHRYRFKPPATPDGFWNIGFDEPSMK